MPAPQGDKDGPLQILVANLDYSDYLGRLAIARVFSGTMKTGEDVAIAKRDGSFQKTKITKLFSCSGLKRTDIPETSLGDIIAVAGVEGITIGETITSAENPAPLPPIIIDEPTIAMLFTINTSPFCGREGNYVTSRNLRERLDKELLTNVSLRMEETGSTDSFKVLGRGELQLSILIEMMRREGYELMVGKPEIVTKRIDGKLQERGTLFAGPGIAVYEGMIIGENAKDTDLDVNIVREKKLTNMRASTSDEAIRLVPYKNLNLEQPIEFIADDEFVEVTPKSLRLRKKVLQSNKRKHGSMAAVEG